MEETRPKNSRLIMVMALIFIIGLIGTYLYNDYVKKLSAPPWVTKAKHDQVSEGMAHAEVVRIIDAPGEHSMTSESPGVPSTVPSPAIETYTWRNRDGSYMNATFKDGLLINKTQFRLR